MGDKEIKTDESTKFYIMDDDTNIFTEYDKDAFDDLVKNGEIDMDKKAKIRITMKPTLSIDNGKMRMNMCADKIYMEDVVRIQPEMSISDDDNLVVEI